MFNGHCAYCGCVLESESGKHMQIDHMEPIQRNIKSEHRIAWGTYKPCENPNADNLKNMYPACPSCNNLKGSLPLESYRTQVQDTIRQLERTTGFQRALRFGMVETKQWDGIFYFEKQQKSEPTI